MIDWLKWLADWLDCVDLLCSQEILAEFFDLTNYTKENFGGVQEKISELLKSVKPSLEYDNFVATFRWESSDATFRLMSFIHIPVDELDGYDDDDDNGDDDGDGGDDDDGKGLLMLVLFEMIPVFSWLFFRIMAIVEITKCD